MPQPKLNGKTSYQNNLKSNKESSRVVFLSVDLYKIYINQLLDLMQESNLGAKISNINCCAPTCADDIALAGSNPLDIQVLVNIASDYYTVLEKHIHCNQQKVSLFQSKHALKQHMIMKIGYKWQISSKSGKGPAYWDTKRLEKLYFGNN